MRIIHIQDAFLSDHTDQLWNLINDSDSKKYQDNLAKVEVYFETFQYEKVVEIASYKVSVILDFVSYMIMFALPFNKYMARDVMS